MNLEGRKVGRNGTGYLDVDGNNVTTCVVV